MIRKGAGPRRRSLHLFSAPHPGVVPALNGKRNVFEGIFSGANYDRITSLFGSAFYRRAAMVILLKPGMHVLDLGCGTASFGLAIAEMIGTGGEVHGVGY